MRTVHNFINQEPGKRLETLEQWKQAEEPLKKEAPDVFARLLTNIERKEARKW